MVTDQLSVVSELSLDAVLSRNSYRYMYNVDLIFGACLGLGVIMNRCRFVLIL